MSWFGILFAARDEPQDSADSGWQFLCGAESEGSAMARVWALHEVIDYDESLAPFMDFPVGTILKRASASEAWKVMNRIDL